MPTLSIRIDGIQQVVKRLGQTVAQETLRAPLVRSMERLRTALATYPPTRPGQTYQRTGNLGRSWKTSVSGMSATIRNNARSPSGARYGPFVQGDKTQARMHHGRWITDRQAVEQETPAIERDFADTINAALSK